MESSFLFLLRRVLEKIFSQTTFHVLLQKSFFKPTPMQIQNGPASVCLEADPFLIVLIFYNMRNLSYPC